VRWETSATRWISVSYLARLADPRVAGDRRVRDNAVIMPTPARVDVSLVRLRTRDGVWLDGVMAEPRRRSVALIWVHGLGSVFSSGQPLIRELSNRLNKAGIGYFKFNNRGHDVVAGRGKLLAGAALERFGHSILDIRAMITFAARSGYGRVVLAGHSTGANKILHYTARARDRRVAGLVLLGPVSDIAAAAKQLGARELERRVAAAERLARRDPHGLVPRAWGYWSARRYISLYRSGEDEDVFQYYRPGARWAALRSVRLPVAAIIGSRDEYLDRRPEALIEAFRKNAARARSFTGLVIRGARHGFQGHEPELADAIVRWVGDTV
jgi:alpha-beta hydrolase superfamily lysophospholipase